MEGLRKSGFEYILSEGSIEDIKENETDYFDELTEEEANTIVEFFISEKKRKGVDPFYVNIYRMLQKGLKVDRVIFIQHNTSNIRIFLKNMFSIPLLFLSGFKAIRDLLEKLSEEASSRYIGGYFSPKDNVIRIVVDRQFKEDVLKGNTEKYQQNDFIPEKSFLEYVILHEACHYFEYNDMKRYLELFYEPMLFPFYTEYLKTIYRSNVSVKANKDVSERAFEKAAKVMISILAAKNKIRPTEEEHMKMFRHLKDELNKVIPELGNIWYYSNPFDGSSQEALKRGYVKIGVDANIVSFFHKYQEMYCTSEVIAVAAFQAYMFGGSLKSYYTTLMKEVF